MDSTILKKSRHKGITMTDASQVSADQTRNRETIRQQYAGIVSALEKNDHPGALECLHRSLALLNSLAEQAESDSGGRNGVSQHSRHLAVSSKNTKARRPCDEHRRDANATTAVKVSGIHMHQF